MSHLVDFDILKEIPGYKAILKSVIKSQIQLLIEQLSDKTGEESIILTASINEGTLSHLGSSMGKGFFEGRDEIKSQFLGYCLKKQQRRGGPQVRSLYQEEHPPERFQPGPSHKRQRVQGVSHSRGEEDYESSRLVPDPTPQTVRSHSPPRNQSFISRTPARFPSKSARSASSTPTQDSPNIPSGADNGQLIMMEGGGDVEDPSMTMRLPVESSVEVPVTLHPTEIPSSVHLSHTQSQPPSIAATDNGMVLDPGHTATAEAEAEDADNKPNVKIEPDMEENETELEITGVEMTGGATGYSGDWGQDAGGGAGYPPSDSGDSSLDQSGSQQKKEVPFKTVTSSSSITSEIQMKRGQLVNRNEQILTTQKYTQNITTQQNIEKKGKEIKGNSEMLFKDPIADDTRIIANDNDDKRSVYSESSNDEIDDFDELQRDEKNEVYCTLTSAAPSQMKLSNIGRDDTSKPFSPSSVGMDLPTDSQNICVAIERVDGEDFFHEGTYITTRKTDDERRDTKVGKAGDGEGSMDVQDNNTCKVLSMPEQMSGISAKSMNQISNLQLENVFECNKCHQTFPSQTGASHEKHCIADRRCEICGYTGRKRQDLKDHEVMHTGEMRYGCHVCGMKFKYRRTRSTHMRKCADSKRVTEIKKTLKTAKLDLKKDSKNYEAPLRSVNESKIKKSFTTGNKCKYCNKIFVSPSKLEAHLPVHTGEKKFSCYKCQQKFKSRSGAREHEKKCSGTKEKLIRHLTKHKKSFSCNWCKKKFTSPYIVKTHQREACKYRKPEDSGTSKSKVKDKKHEMNRSCADSTCHICRKTFSKSSNLRDHMVVHTGEKNFSCRKCGKKYKWSSGARRHGLKCGGKITWNGSVKRDTKCKPCDKMFKSSSKKRSMADLTCHTCKKTFPSITKLREHKTVHTGEKNFLCNKCGKRFKWRSVGRDHRQKCKGQIVWNTDYVTSEIKNTICKICSKIFKSASDFKLHLHLHGDAKKVGLDNQQQQSLAHSAAFVVKSLFCSWCLHRFRNSEELREHQRECSERKLLSSGSDIDHKEKRSANKELSVQENDSSKKQDIQWFPCETCGKRFRFRMSLHAHQSRKQCLPSKISNSDPNHTMSNDDQSGT